MQLKSVSYESSLWPDLFNRLTTSEIEENEKPKMVTVIHPDGKSINYLWKKTQIYEQFRKLFNEKRYSFEKFIPVDKHQIGLDLTNNNQSLLHPFLLEYSILEKTSLIQIKIKYEEKINDYFTTLECPFINIFDRCLNYSNLNLISNEDKVFCFFDENRRWIYDGTVEEQKKKEIYITLTEIDRSTSINEICYRTEQNKQNNFNIDSQMNLIVLDEEKKVLFHPDTTWKNLDKWFRQQSMGKNLKKDLFSYYLKEKRIVVSENELIFSSHELITIDVINQDSTMNVKISYEDQSKEICVLKGMKVNQLLNNEYLLLQLNLNGTSFQDYVLAFGENNHQIISKEDTHKSISEFFVDDEHIVEFRIGILIQIFTSNHEEKPQEIPLFTRKISIEELFQICKGSERRFKHIASYKTKKILAICQLLTDIDETRFLLLEEDQICSIQIQRSPDNQLIKIDDYSTITQDFASVATIADIYKVNQTAIQNEFLLFENDFLLSMETSLSVLKSTSTIQFNVKNEKLPIHIYVENSVNKQTIDYYSSLTISIHRLCFVACQLMLLNPIFYQLMHDEKKLSDGEMCLKNLEAISNEVKFKLICIASIEVSIKYQQVTILIPCTMQTLISDLIKETLLKLNIPNNDLSMFELVALGNQRTQVEFDYTIDDIHQELFPENTKTLPFELETKNSE
ncbi:hypothetical protein I4U23_022131 [Adineta vaga]|nr:hypothetical protein I4U23_022131 [Adineta vaga]